MIRPNLPSSNSKSSSRGGVRARSCQSRVADGRARGNGGCQLDDGDIAVKGVLVETRVGLDGRDLDNCSARVPVLKEDYYLLTMTKSRMTYQGPSADRDLRSRVCHTAVTCGDDGVCVEEGATAEVRAAHLQGDDEGEVSSSGSLSTDDVDTRCTGLSGRDGRSSSSGGREGSGGERLDTHCVASWGDLTMLPV